MFIPNLGLPDVLHFLTLGLTFIFACIIILGAASVTINRMNIQRRLSGSAAAKKDYENPHSLRTAAVENVWAKLVGKIEKRGISLGDTKSSLIKERLVAAGFFSPEALSIYTFTRLTLTLGLPLLLLTLLYFSGENLTITKAYVLGSISAIIGLYLPNIYIYRKGARRRQDLLNGFPDALDLMLVCVEAGLGLDAAFAKVGSEMVRSQPLIAEMLATVSLELRAGRSREEALLKMGERSGVPEIRAFSTLLIQSEKLGSSIGKTLRVYASEMRERRRLRAEEKAHRLPVLLSIPLVTCMLPTMIGVLMVPAIIRVIRQVLPALTGHH
jgi:tight adherence protein C